MDHHTFFYFLRHGVPRPVTKKQRREDALKSAKEAVALVNGRRRKGRKAGDVPRPVQET